MGGTELSSFDSGVLDFPESIIVDRNLKTDSRLKNKSLLMVDRHAKSTYPKQLLKDTSEAVVKADRATVLLI